MNKILLFITIIFGSFFSLNAQSSASKPITNNDESRKAERFVLVINNLDKEGQFDAGKNYSWYLINVVSEDEKKVIEKMKIVLASYKPEITETLNTNNKLSFSISFGMPIKTKELASILRGTNIWIKSGNTDLSSPTIQEIKD